MTPTASTPTVETKRKPLVITQTQTFVDAKDTKEALAALAALAPPAATEGIKWEPSTSSVTIGGKSYVRGYFKPVGDLNGLLAAAQSDPIGTLKDWNYGMGLAYNNDVRNAMSDAIPQDPEVAIKKIAESMVKNFASMGLTITLEKAVEQVRAQAKAQVA